MIMQVCYNENIMYKVAYLIDIFKELRNLNKSLQGVQINNLTQNAEINIFT
jgi:hypothetical protein